MNASYWSCWLQDKAATISADFKHHVTGGTHQRLQTGLGSGELLFQLATHQCLGNLRCQQTEQAQFGGTAMSCFFFVQQTDKTEQLATIQQGQRQQAACTQLGQPHLFGQRQLRQGCIEQRASVQGIGQESKRGVVNDAQVVGRNRRNAAFFATPDRHQAGVIVRALRVQIQAGKTSAGGFAHGGQCCSQALLVTLCQQLRQHVFQRVKVGLLQCDITPQGGVQHSFGPFRVYHQKTHSTCVSSWRIVATDS